MSKLETTILTPSGDVLVCRGRDSLFQDYRVPHDPAPSHMCGVMDGFCFLCAPTTGLLGGQEDVMEKENYYQNNDNITQDLSGPPSFDYSQYEVTVSPDKRQPLGHSVATATAAVPATNNGDGLTKLFGSLLSTTTTDHTHTHSHTDSHTHTHTKLQLPNSNSTTLSPAVLHGVPTCLLREIRISAISAHALGSHVLLISTEALLFSYGSNQNGQLGLGISQQFISTPTLVTAVLEGGGKTLHCAAGVDYSLIVVKTNEERVRNTGLQRLDSDASEDRQQSHHHQVYGFGSNKKNKLGLYNNTTDTNRTLPHRVALHAKVEQPDNVGIFCVAAAKNHSAALVKQRGGAIDLYMWGESGALGLSSESGAVTKVESLSYTPAWHDEDSYLEKHEYPTQVALGVNCTFVLFNTGRCLSFGGSQLLPEKVSLEPTQIQLDIPISSLSVGAQHVLATCKGNKVYSWGMDPATLHMHDKPILLDQRALQSYAGIDMSAFILRDGILLTNGVKSGRLGQGEVPANPRRPSPLFGGLRLWR